MIQAHKKTCRRQVVSVDNCIIHFQHCMSVASYSQFLPYFHILHIPRQPTLLLRLCWSQLDLSPSTEAQRDSKQVRIFPSQIVWVVRLLCPDYHLPHSAQHCLITDFVTIPVSRQFLLQPHTCTMFPAVRTFSFSRWGISFVSRHTRCSKMTIVLLKYVVSPPLASPASNAVCPAFTSLTALRKTVMISVKLTGGGDFWPMFSLMGSSALARAPPPRLAKGTCPRDRPVMRSNDNNDSKLTKILTIYVTRLKS